LGELVWGRKMRKVNLLEVGYVVGKKGTRWKLTRRCRRLLRKLEKTFWSCRLLCFYLMRKLIN